jgi:PAS domain S-box-containing protein
MSTPTRPVAGNARVLACFTQAVLDTAGEAIVTLDGDGIVRSFNRAAERMFGWSEADIVGAHVDRLMPRPEETRRADHLSASRLESGPLFGRSRKVVGLRHDGSRFPMDLSVSQFEGDDGPQFTWILRDITEQAFLQEQLRQAQKMDAIGRLAGGVAHDFNNLLTVINGWCEALSSASADERTAAIDQITSAAAKAANLTGQLLSFSRKSALNPCVVDLNPVIDDIGRMLRRVIGEDIRLETVLMDAPAFVTIDQGQLSQVLVNLALNARDAMPRGGCLRVDTACLELDARAAAGASVPPGRYIRRRHRRRQPARRRRAVLDPLSRSGTGARRQRRRPDAEKRRPRQRTGARRRRRRAGAPHHRQHAEGPRLSGARGRDVHGGVVARDHARPDRPARHRRGDARAERPGAGHAYSHGAPGHVRAARQRL